MCPLPISCQEHSFALLYCFALLHRTSPHRSVLVLPSLPSPFSLHRTCGHCLS
jgi:hypothetical protein